MLRAVSSKKKPKANKKVILKLNKKNDIKYLRILLLLLNICRSEGR
jgi:hypothetical protein